MGLFFLVATGASAFNVAAPARPATQLNLKSQAIPFLTCPPKLDGTLVGDVGFDPLQLSDIQEDLVYSRAAELKHGRIAMLATVGFVVEEYIRLPGDAYSNPDPIGAIKTAGFGPNIQIFLGIAIVELITLKNSYGDDGEPGDFGWDPAQLLSNKTPEQIKDFKYSEIINGRLAMMGFLGQLVQTLYFHKPLFSVF